MENNVKPKEEVITKEIEATKNNEQIVKESMPDLQKEALKLQLENYMQTEKPYLQAQLKISDLAKGFKFTTTPFIPVH